MKRKNKNVAKKKTKQNKTATKQGQETKETVDQEVQQEVKQTEESENEDASPAEDNWESRYNEMNDKYLRLYSEFDNYRKRTIKERLEHSKTASEEVIVELLPVLDDFERAIKSSEEVENCEPVIEGMKLIFNKLSGMLEKKGLKAIEAIGKEFDTDFHEAITYIPAPSDDMKNKIVDDVQKGYMLHDKVIRYSKVVIGQ